MDARAAESAPPPLRALEEEANCEKKMSSQAAHLPAETASSSASLLKRKPPQSFAVAPQKLSKKRLRLRARHQRRSMLRAAHRAWHLSTAAKSEEAWQQNGGWKIAEYGRK